MSMFRSKVLDIGCFVNIKVIRDHTKRKVFAEHETQRYGRQLFTPLSLRKERTC
jgi:small subunit ribosomal protein S14